MAEDENRGDVKARTPRVEAEGPTDPVAPLADLVDGLTVAPDLEGLLKCVVDHTALFLGTEHVSLRLLDETRARLLVAARSGRSLHANDHTEFAVGEGFVGIVVESGQTLRIARAGEDPRFCPKPGMVSSFRSFLGVPLFDAEGCIGVIATTSEREDAFFAADERRLKLVAGIVTPHIRVARLKRIAEIDPVTSSLNRHALGGVFAAAALRRPEPTSVLLIDLDHFKRLNDRLGHARGDEALRAVVEALASVLRQSDSVVRLGGDEFLSVLPGADGEAAALVAERARVAIDERLLAYGDRTTVSIGVAEWREGEPTQSLLERVDAAMYRAKEAGRDRVVRDPAAG
jgi:diguanylate cyclase (GGDEF)-like protein